MSTQDLTPAALEAWLARYKQAWEQRDPARAAALFTENAPTTRCRSTRRKPAAPASATIGRR